ncbi:hypothetical protein EZV62_024233 [Acer yangbiense]|uniref:Uncharacterized protein n=1 Tax=Acer yangbiense TaxID=1000413 RepID=A0A5C7H4Q0_9ROSI|nr:hypothetical protein EZV62_024233 [Acer yangbiense]
MSAQTTSYLPFNLEGIDDVDDYTWVSFQLENAGNLGNEGEGSLPWDRYSHVFDLMQNGNRAFRENHFEEAINNYSRANNIKPSDPIILGNRSSAYLRISQFLKHRPPSASEHSPLSGLDPTTHAELAVKDAEKLLNILNNSVKPYILKSIALILVRIDGESLRLLVDADADADVVAGDGRDGRGVLERYEVARNVILSGLQVDPYSNTLKTSLQNLARASSSLIGKRSHGRPERTDDFDCTLCLKLLYEPITTPCGHSFCRSCLFQSMDRGNKCPLCRTILFISPRTCAVRWVAYMLIIFLISCRSVIREESLLAMSFVLALVSCPAADIHGSSVTLNNIIQKNFAEEYAERKLEHDSLINFGADLIPLFVMDVVIPCQKFPLHIFEPRYRLMVRRIMEGNRRMGMVIIDPTTSAVADFACEVEITECEPLPDGRFVLEVKYGLCILLKVAEDFKSFDLGIKMAIHFVSYLCHHRNVTCRYRIAEVEWVQDTVPTGAEDREELQELTNNAAEYSRLWLRRKKEAARQDRRRLEKLLNVEVMMPTSQDPERFSFWLATLSERRPSERLELLRIRDTRERVRRGLIFLRAEEQGCRVQ